MNRARPHKNQRQQRQDKLRLVGQFLLTIWGSIEIVGLVPHISCQDALAVGECTDDAFYISFQARVLCGIAKHSAAQGPAPICVRSLHAMCMVLPRTEPKLSLGKDRRLRWPAQPELRAGGRWGLHCLGKTRDAREHRRYFYIDPVVARTELVLGDDEGLTRWVRIARTTGSSGYWYGRAFARVEERSSCGEPGEAAAEVSGPLLLPAAPSASTRRRVRPLRAADGGWC